MLTDAELAALESRLAPVLVAQGGRGVVDRHDVLALLAEVRMLREPPDVAGLMPAADLDAFRRAGFPGEGFGLTTREAHHIFAHIDALQSLVRELYAVVADLREDLAGRDGGAYVRGRAEGRDGVATWLERLSSAHEPAIPHGLGRVCFRCMAALATAVRKLGPCRPPLPPCESERLLRGLLAAGGGLTFRPGPQPDDWIRRLQAAFGAARAALGEDAG